MRLVWLLPCLLCGCVATGSSSRAPASSTRPPSAQIANQSLLTSGKPPQALHWTRTSAEHRAILLQAYHGAEPRLRELAAPLTPGSWGVMLDADETVLGNSLCFQRQAEHGLLDFGYNSWTSSRKPFHQRFPAPRSSRSSCATWAAAL